VLGSAGASWSGSLAGEATIAISMIYDWEGFIDRETAELADLEDPDETEIRRRPIEEGSREWRISWNGCGTIDSIGSGFGFPESALRRINAPTRCPHPRRGSMPPMGGRPA
jgi:hypothetical protein